MTGIIAGMSGFGQTAAPPASVSISDQEIWDSYPGDATASYQLGNNDTVTNQDSNILES